MSGLQVRVRHRFAEFELDVDSEIPLRGVTALLGHSGAGKSSVIAAIAGVLRPDEGRIALADECLFDASSGVFTPPEARRFGCVMQKPLLFPHLTVQDNCRFGAKRCGTGTQAQDYASIYQLLDLTPLLQRFPRHLSGGEQQRVALARALLSQPRLLLLDEPLAAVDERKRRDVFPYLERLRDELSLPMVYVSHAVDEVARLADQVMVIEQGRVTRQGATNTILARRDAVLARDGGSVVHGLIARHDAAEQLTTIAFDGGELVVPQTTGEVGAAVRLFVRADDVMLSTAPLEQVSAHNVLPVRIDQIEHHEDGSAHVQLSCKMTPLLARLTSSSVRRLGLSEGHHVFAAFKAQRLNTSGLG